MPRKVRQLIADLEEAGFVNRGGKGSHRNFTHPRGLRVTLSAARATTPGIIRNATCAAHWTPPNRVELMTRKQIKKQAARYEKFVEWSDEDKCFIGRCPEIMAGGVHGRDEARVYAELCRAVEEMIELIHSDGHILPQPLQAKKFSGKFVLRVDPALHRRLAAKALAAGESLNSYCAKTLIKSK